MFFCWKVETPRDGRWLFITAPPLPCFVLGTTTEPPPPCHFAQQRQQRAMPPLCVAVHNRLSYGRNAVARLRCTPLLPPKDRISYHRRGTLAQAAYSIVSWCPPLLQKPSFPQLPHFLSAIAGNDEGRLEYTLAPRPRQEEARAPAHRPPRAGSPPCFIQASRTPQPAPFCAGSSRSRPCCSHSLRHVRAAIARAKV